jgi:valyl-tRNA synthetase
MLSENMKELSREFDILAIEKKWQNRWEEMGLYHFDWKDRTRPSFSIDTPPPYPSGDLHMGNLLNWTYFDILARYKRMNGFNVHFPQGWDCHGLGIEIQVEKENGIKKREMPPDNFRQLCEKLVKKYIAIMKEGIMRLGCSNDWTLEYRTMDPDYWRRTQLSFILLHKKGFMYQGTHPVNWCPRCETAIADAEVDYEQRDGTLHYLRFAVENSDEYIRIATTRPELIPACVAVAVHPEDTRFFKYKDRRLKVPETERTVPIIFDETIDPSFGTGAVMICTYGDKADVKTVIRHKLPVIIILAENGRINQDGGKYAGLTSLEARKAIVADLAKEGLLEKTEKITQEIGLCDRCDSPVEILQLRQWFMKTRELTDRVEKAANQVLWYPDYMKVRLIDWARSLDWDWVISRQRVFGTPIPTWYCKKCNETILAEENWVPIDPKTEKPRITQCPKCGSSEFIPELDVFDTWMDSSISCAVHAGWPDSKDWKRLFPADVHPSGIDIIRTWAYYLMVRHLALFDEAPYKSCLINGMVLGADGRKMSKSLKNYVATPEVLDKRGADAARQWAAGGGTTGSDIPFRWPDVEYSWRFLIKLWNAAGFVSKLLADYTTDGKTKPVLQPLDKWILSKCERLTGKVTDALEKCQFNLALEELRNFTWHTFCDCYLEAVKDRLYNPEIYGQEKRKAAQYALHVVLERVLKLLSPIIPHVTEEIFQTLYVDEKNPLSIHVSPWPTTDEKLVNEEAEKQGDMVVAIITEVRREKSEKHLPLNAKIVKLTIYAGEKTITEMITQGRVDIAGACKAADIHVLSEKGKGREVKPYDVAFIAEYSQ